MKSKGRNQSKVVRTSVLENSSLTNVFNMPFMPSQFDPEPHDNSDNPLRQSVAMSMYYESKADDFQK